MRSHLLKGCLALVAIFLYATPVTAQDCSALNPCASGCCSKFGYCGTGEEFCSAENCVANCDFKLGCDASNPCKGKECCSKHGFCGLGPDYCAPEICVAGCDSKSYCDPGYGSEYAEISKCPLNVCCSKWGYCGITPEFCGDKKVKRPSCSKSGSLERVIGYYEGWVGNRPCNAFYPEQLPLGVYTHLNYAFATVSPDTFEVLLPTEREKGLLKRLVGLKRADPDLKVFIAIGGWTFNDPGQPTQKIFSDLARSEDNQRKFFKSLISFLSTYDLDGVDLDWEYPGPDDITDRGGREEDFKNFPKFMKNLKSALKSTGGRDGISITLPASYWFLQFFDIVELEKHISFFNIMSYDLHGAWDKGNKWTGAFLNAHTNLTEITDAMDLLWRNNISPSKVVLGLAFYGRAFTATSESCMTPGCTFESAAEKGPCSRENGILMNSEIIDIIREKGLKPKLYEKEAVKVVHWGNQWVAFDDKETLKMKADFARGQCLGGVMVWAISHDITHSLSGAVNKRQIEYHYDYSDPGAFTYAIASATNRTGSLLPIGDGDGGKDGDQYDIKRTNHDSCYWSGCLQGCASGFTLVSRADDESKHDDEMMYDDTGCDGKGIRKLCCPKSDIPLRCGWYTHGNGKCKQFCPSGMIEIGSNKNYCNKNYQAACCTKETKSIAVYDTCDWAESPMCDNGDCEHYAYMKNELFTSSTGSGGAVCNMRWATMQGDYDVQRRKYCCDTGIKEKKWTQCERVFSLSSPQGNGFCNSDCPSGKIKVGLDRYSENCRSKSGTEAICCKPELYTEKKTDNPLLAEDAKAIDAFFDSLDDGNSDICKADVIFEHKKRRRSLGSAQDSGSALATRDTGSIYDRMKFLDILALAYAGKMSSWRLEAFIKKYNEKVPKSAEHSNFNSTRDYAQEWAAEVPGSRSWDEAADFAACNFYYVDDQIQREESGGSSWISCARPFDPCADDPDLCSTDDDLPPERCVSGSSDTSASSILQKRTNTYCYIYVTVNGGTAQGTVTSLDYLSAGLWPAGSVQLTQAITMRDETDCAEADMRYVVLVVGNTAGYQTEHIFELNTFAAFLEDMARNRLAQLRTSRQLPAYSIPGSHAPLPPQFFAPAFMNAPVMVPTANFVNPPGNMNPVSAVPSQRIMQAIGSETNAECFFLLNSRINNMKSRVWRWRVRENGDMAPLPVSDARMRDFVNADNPTNALDRIRRVISVFRYLDDYVINACLIRISNDIREQLYQAARAFNIIYNTNIDPRPHWDEWVRYHYNGMANRARTWATDWLNLLELRWTGVNTPAGAEAREQIRRLRNQLFYIRFRDTGLD